MTNLLEPNPVPTEPEILSHVGRLVTQYAMTEGALHRLARKLSGLSEAKARIVFGGMRRIDLVQRTRALMALAKRSSRSIAEFETCASQLQVIADHRDLLAHRASLYSKGVLIATNVLTSRDEASSERAIFSREDLQALHDDCLSIFMRFRRLAGTDLLVPKETRKYVQLPMAV